MSNEIKEKFTTGPWKVNECETPGVLKIDCGGIMYITVITYAYDLSYSDRVECTANAHLMASAPDMYRMLQEIKSTLGTFSPVVLENLSLEQYVKNINEILAKARGEHIEQGDK